MSEIGTASELILPALILGALGFVVPRLFALALPEGVPPLMLNALLSTLTLFVLAALTFLALYLWQGAPWAELSVQGWAANLGFFGRLGLIAAIIWAPVMVLSLAGLPKKWKEAVW
ncbi:MAG: hypothetical protein AAFU41_00220 [Pseudomonadota bacterium]